MASQTFEYSPLEARDFRILLLSPGERSDHLRATLKHVSLDDDAMPEYETTSYACGEASLTASIFVDGEPLAIPASSAEVLCRVRKSDSIRTLWIDAVCIDGSNITERGRQVSLMCDVYFRGSSNIIYLGESDELSVEGLWMLECVVAEMASQTGGLSNIQRSIIDKYGVDQRLHDMRVKSPYSNRALHSIYRRTWFSRLWVLQEAFLSSVSNCLLGDSMLSLQDILAAGVYVWRNYLIERELRQPFHNATRLYYLIYRGYSDEVRRVNMRPTLVNCLEMSAHFDVSVPADSVFAMLGLFAHHVGSENPETWNLLRPDYTKPTKAVITDASRAAIITSSGMDIFSFIDHEDERHVLAETAPSWALDPHCDRKRSRAYGFSRWKYNASNNLPAQEISHLPSRFLAVKGLFLDDIVEVGPSLAADTYLSWHRLRHFTRASAVVVQCPSLPAAGDSTFHNLSRTLVAGLTLSRQRVAPPAPSGATFLLRSLQIASTNMALQPVELEYRQALVVACHMRRVFRTRDGLVGLGPAAARVGDTLTILYESNMPSLLRPAERDHHHHFIGNCYVDGMMDGEASTRFGRDSDRHKLFLLQ
jgi:hypothetical protein